MQDKRFEWENWINAAMELLKAMNGKRVKKLEKEYAARFVGPFDLIKLVDLSRPMLQLNGPHDEIEELPGTLYV